jgi:hypothetical protein
MAVQDETLLVGEPFRTYLTSFGWHTEKTHGNQYQEGFPDIYCMHSKFSPRWVEFKVFDEYGHITLTQPQKVKFQIWTLCNIPIFIIAADDLRGEKHLILRERLYKKLFNEPNVMYAYNRKMHCFLR